MGRNFHIYFLGAVATLCCLIGVINYVVDPFFYYRKPIGKFELYQPNYQRIQNFGVAKNFEFDSVVVGGSLAENFSTDQLYKELGWHAVNLSISSSSAYEQSRILEYALNRKNVKNVLWVVQWNTFAHPLNFTPQSQSVDYKDFDAHIYQLKNFIFNKKVLYLSLNSLAGNPLERRSSRNLAWNWERGRDVGFGCEYVKREFDENVDSGLQFDSIEASFQKYLLESIKNNLDIKFYIVMSPYSKWRYVSQQSVEGAINFRHLVASKLANYKNVKIYDFQSDPSIILNADLYKDPGHYSEYVNQLIVNQIASWNKKEMQSSVNFTGILNSTGNCSIHKLK